MWEINPRSNKDKPQISRTLPDGMRGTAATAAVPATAATAALADATAQAAKTTAKTKACVSIMFARTWWWDSVVGLGGDLFGQRMVEVRDNNGNKGEEMKKAVEKLVGRG